MRTLKDVYIKVTEKNQEELGFILRIHKPEIGYNISFNSDSLDNVTYGSEYKQKVSLSQLKRLIDTIPTREEITRLKRQISAYKTNYDKVVKHSLSKEDVIEELQRKLNRERSRTADLFKQRKEVQLNHCKQIRTLAQEVERVKSLYGDALKENERCKELQRDNDILVDCMEKLDDKLEATERKLDIQADLIRDKNAQIKQLKQRKWWQIWK